MSNPWFRMYSEFSHDPKVQMLSEAMQRRYIMVMCLRCSEQLEGRTDEEIAFFLRIDADSVAETKALFIKKCFVDSEWNLLNWEKRQFTADSSASRVQKYRANRKALGLTSNGYTKHSVTVNNRDGHACVYCGSNENLCIDHVLPTCKGGDDSIENLATACKTCNSGKAGRTPEEAGYSFINKATEKLWLSWVASRQVTVTVTAQNRTDTDKNREDKKNTSAIAPPVGVSSSVWDDFLKLRRAKKAPLTQSAVDGIQREADKAGLMLVEALTMCCARGWTGFKAEWVQPEKQSTSETAYQKSMRERVAEFAPAIAKRAPGQEFIDMEISNVTAIAGY